MSITFGGINIMSKNPVASFEFYKGIGLVVLEEVAPDNEWYGAMFQLTDDKNGPLLWIWRHRENDPMPQNFIVINCEDIEQTHVELLNKGYSVSVPVIQPYGGKEMTLIDPDSNIILFLGA